MRQSLADEDHKRQSGRVVMPLLKTRQKTLFGTSREHE